MEATIDRKEHQILPILSKMSKEPWNVLVPEITIRVASRSPMDAVAALASISMKPLFEHERPHNFVDSLELLLALMPNSNLQVDRPTHVPKPAILYIPYLVQCYERPALAFLFHQKRLE